MNRKLIMVLIVSLLAMVIYLPLASANVDCFPAETCDDMPYGISEAEILSYPEPNVIPLDVDTEALDDRWYQQITGTIDIYDNPNGQIIGKLDSGFNFVTALNSQDGWTQINTGQWVKSESLATTNYIISRFTGVILPDEPLPYPMAWALVNLYPSSAPGESPLESNGLVYRYTRVNLYAAVELNGETWYQIGVGKWVLQYHVARILPVQRPADVDTERWVSIDLYEQVAIAYEGMTPVFATLVASGMADWPTNEGLFHIFFRTLRKNMSGGTPGDDFYYLEEVPWTMFFDEGRALHGAYWHDGFGYRRSHGCVNLSITDAHWLYKWVAETMGSNASSDIEDGPAVYVYSSGLYQ